MGPINKLKLPEIQVPNRNAEPLQSAREAAAGDGKISGLKEGLQKAAANFDAIQKAAGKYVTASATGGADATASLEQMRLGVGAHAQASINAHLSGEGAVAAGDQALHTKGAIEAEAAAVLQAHGSAGLKQPGFSAGAEAFLGVRAAIEGGAAIVHEGDEAGHVTGRAEGWAGAGAEASVKASQDGDTLHAEAGAGAGLFVGGAVAGEVSIDAGTVARAIRDK